MTNEPTVEVKCLNCGNWFPSQIGFGSMESFDTSELIGNLAQCRNCGAMTPIDKENMRVRGAKEGFVGDMTADARPRNWRPFKGLYPPPATRDPAAYWQPQKVETDKTFGPGEEVRVDGTRFERCTFRGCTMIYTGEDFAGFSGCSLDRSMEWKIGDPALKVFQFLTLLHSSGLSGLVDRWFEQIRGKEVPPPSPRRRDDIEPEPPEQRA